MSPAPRKPAVEVPKEESQGANLGRDIQIWGELESIMSDFGHSNKHMLELWPSYVRRLHMARFLAHYELFKHTVDLPGSFVELGVYRGASFFTWAKLLETFCPGDRSRVVYGFDNFSGLKDFSEKDGKILADRGKAPGAYSAGAVKDEIYRLSDLTNQDCFIPQRGRCHLVDGDIEDTLPRFLEEHTGLRISMLHFDVDLYRPTKFALERLYPLVVRGGVVVFDEYGLEPWEGESNAVDEYFSEIGISPVIKKFPFVTQPHGYFIK